MSLCEARVAALFVATNGAYFGNHLIDPWDEKRDARLYAGRLPVVAHPPCNVWCQLYYVGNVPPPPLDWRDVKGEAVIGGGINSGECVGRRKIEKREASATPAAFRDLLIDLALVSQAETDDAAAATRCQAVGCDAPAAASLDSTPRAWPPALLEATR